MTESDRMTVIICAIVAAVIGLPFLATTSISAAYVVFGIIGLIALIGFPVLIWCMAEHGQWIARTEIRKMHERCPHLFPKDGGDV